MAQSGDHLEHRPAGVHDVFNNDDVWAKKLSGVLDALDDHRAACWRFNLNEVQGDLSGCVWPRRVQLVHLPKSCQIIITFDSESPGLEDPGKTYILPLRWGRASSAEAAQPGLERARYTGNGSSGVVEEVAWRTAWKVYYIRSSRYRYYGNAPPCLIEIWARLGDIDIGDWPIPSNTESDYLKYIFFIITTFTGTW